VLFSEPKILNVAVLAQRRPRQTFQCSSASRKFSIGDFDALINARNDGFSALQRAENSQLTGQPVLTLNEARFSALQRAENSQLRIEKRIHVEPDAVSVLFSEPKILNHSRANCIVTRSEFQCSSASRKFSIVLRARGGSTDGVFQCSSASRKFSITVIGAPSRVKSEFQCSSASRKFSIQRRTEQTRVDPVVSVLFSEPKILNPTQTAPFAARPSPPFQCSSASRKFSIDCEGRQRIDRIWFQCSSASRKFSILRLERGLRRNRRFQCSSASRKFSISRQKRRRSG